MEPNFDEALKQENLLTRYPYLESLLKYYSPSFDKKSTSMNDYLIILKRITFPYKENSDAKLVNKTENIFHIMIKNSIRLDKDSILFKALSYFIQKGFDLFISALKAEEVVSKKQFNKSLLDMLNSENIEKYFNLSEGDVEKCLKLVQFKKVMKKVKFTNKIVCFILLFFRKFIEEKDKIIIEEISQYVKEKDINDFYSMYNEGQKNKEDEKVIENNNKNENKDDLLEPNKIAQKIDNSSNQ
jgi:hypothetical protein